MSLTFFHSLCFIGIIQSAVSKIDLYCAINRFAIRITLDLNVRVHAEKVFPLYVSTQAKIFFLKNWIERLLIIYRLLLVKVRNISLIALSQSQFSRELISIVLGFKSDKYLSKGFIMNNFVLMCAPDSNCYIEAIVSVYNALIVYEVSFLGHEVDCEIVTRDKHAEFIN